VRIFPTINVLRAIHPRHNPTQETLERLLTPFKLADWSGRDQTAQEGADSVVILDALPPPGHSSGLGRQRLLPSQFSFMGHSLVVANHGQCSPG
jgi:hypothetical protein